MSKDRRTAVIVGYICSAMLIAFGFVDDRGFAFGALGVFSTTLLALGFYGN